jgi:hypothetical protein
VAATGFPGLGALMAFLHAGLIALAAFRKVDPMLVVLALLGTLHALTTVLVVVALHPLVVGMATISSAAHVHLTRRRSVLLFRRAVLLRLVTALTRIVVLVVVAALLVHPLLADAMRVVRLPGVAAFRFGLPPRGPNPVAVAALGPILRLSALLELANLMFVSLVSGHVVTCSVQALMSAASG